jgi:hypothetical protein
MPADQGGRLDDDQSLAPVKEARQLAQSEAISPCGPLGFMLVLLEQSQLLRRKTFSAASAARSRKSLKLKVDPSAATIFNAFASLPSCVFMLGTREFSHSFTLAFSISSGFLRTTPLHVTTEGRAA